MRTENLARHGDLSFRKIAKLPKGLKTRKGLVLAEGEFTGHAHRLSGKDVAILENDSEMYVEVRGSDANLTHEEHSKIILAPGTYKVITEREYDYFLEETRKVLD